MHIHKKKLRGSVLVFTLLVLALLLSASISAALVIITAKNSSRATQKSIISFQIADGAAENILKRVYQDSDSSLNVLSRNLFGTNYFGFGFPTCVDGVIVGRLPSSVGTYEVTLYDNDGNKLRCDGVGYSSYAEWRPKLVRLMSVGNYAGTTRAIDVGVRP